MMGQHTRSESLFYYFRLEDQVPEGHLLRMIDTHIDFSFVREQLRTATVIQAVRRSIRSCCCELFSSAIYMESAASASW